MWDSLIYAIMNDFSPKKLALALVEKHDRFISEYSDEIEKMQQVTMLTEKRDQLVHWIAENGSKGKYAKELEETDKELKNIQSSMKEKPQSHYSALKERIDEHKKARSYWLGKVGEHSS